MDGGVERARETHMRVRIVCLVIAVTVALASAQPRALDDQRIGVTAVALADVQQWDRALKHMERDGRVRIRESVSDSGTARWARAQACLEKRSRSARRRWLGTRG